MMNLTQLCCKLSIAFVMLLLVGCRVEAPQPTLNPTGFLPISMPTATLSAGSSGFGPVTGPVYTQPSPLHPDHTAEPTSALMLATLVLPTGIAPTLGSVVGPNYTQPPTSTGQPTMQSTPTQGLGGNPGNVPTFGPVVGPNYTPPPTQTPAPTINSSDLTLPPVSTTGPSATPGPVLRSSLMGIQIHGFLRDDQWQQMLDHSKALGVTWIKVQVPWKEYEPAKGSYTDYYQALVLNVQRASLRGFRTMISIAKAPGWSRTNKNEDGPPDNPQDLADFTARIVRDIKPEFLDAVEIWNEPNLIREWQGKPLSGAEYMRYFKPAYDAVLNEQKLQPPASKPTHRIIVITAGVAPTGTTAGISLNDREWLQQLYDSGIGAYGEDVAIGVHPYGWSNPPDATCCAAQAGVTGWYEHPSFYFRENIEAFRQIMTKNNDLVRKMWVTEFGWATYDGLKRSDGNAAAIGGGSAWMNFLSQQQQADYVLRAFGMAQKPPYYDYLGPMILWNLNFATLPGMTDNGREEAGFSLLDGAGNPRPVYWAVKNAQKE